MKSETKLWKKFNLVVPKDYDQSDRAGRETTPKSAFTLIELIVVMAVIGVLVLLAAPKFIGYTERARETKHIHTAKVIETALEAYLINGGVFPDDLEVVDITLLKEASDKETLIGTNGYVKAVEGEIYYELTYDFIKKLDVKLSAKNEILIEAAASFAPEAMYSSPRGVTVINKAKTLKGYTASPTGGDSNKEDEYSEEIKSLIEQGYIPVATAEDLDDVRNNVVGKYVQVADIDLSAISNFEPIPEFLGIYNGSGFKVLNLKIEKIEDSSIGLFKRISSPAIIENVNLINVEIYGKSGVGALVGYVNSDTLINNTTATGTVSANGTFLGGMIGVNNGIVQKSSFRGVINGKSQGTGGLIGANNRYGEIIDSYADVEIKGDSWRTGGLAGQNEGIINSCYAKGAIYGLTYVGGLVGANMHIIRNSYAYTDTAGSRDEIGGLVGKNGYAFISSKLYTIGEVTNSFSIGTVTGDDEVGGAIGINDGAKLKGVRANSLVYANTNKGQIYGKSIVASGTSSLYGKFSFSPSITNTLYLDKESMKVVSNFSGWDLENVWEILPGKNHPTLINNKEE